MRIPVVDTIIEKREKQRRKAKIKRGIYCAIKVLAVILVLFSFVMSLINMIERLIKGSAERKKKIKEFIAKVKAKLPTKEKETACYFENFGGGEKTDCEIKQAQPNQEQQ
ncbi:MAG: hypothetical protein RSB78_04275 [Oscillospiraceae bacterium]